MPTLFEFICLQIAHTVSMYISFHLTPADEHIYFGVNPVFIPNRWDLEEEGTDAEIGKLNLVKLILPFLSFNKEASYS